MLKLKELMTEKTILIGSIENGKKLSKIANKFEQDIKISELSDEELQPIIDIISQIHIDLPEELQAYKDQNNLQKGNHESNTTNTN